MPTRQRSLGLTATSPSNIVHIVDAEYVGNDVRIRTKCGIVPADVKQWERVYGSTDGERKCQRCFA